MRQAAQAGDVTSMSEAWSAPGSTSSRESSPARRAAATKRCDWLSGTSSSAVPCTHIEGTPSYTSPTTTDASAITASITRPNQVTNRSMVARSNKSMA